MTALERLEEIVQQYDADLEFKVACACAWSGQLRLTLTNPDMAPSRSITFYSTGGFDPEEVAAALLADVQTWLAETEEKPLPVPDWVTG